MFILIHQQLIVPLYNQVIEVASTVPGVIAAAETSITWLLDFTHGDSLVIDMMRGAGRLEVEV